MKRLVAIVGPTAAGKSALALRLSCDYDGEIVSADSRQVYRFLDIGTAKPTRDERLMVLHHLIDIIDPDADFSLAQYQELAFKTIAQIQDRNRLPFLVGGSGLYVWAVLDNWNIPRVIPDMNFRRQLEDRAARGESGELYQELIMLDPVAAARIDPHNIRRIIRALEINKAAVKRLSTGYSPGIFESLIIGLTMDRGELYRRIDDRVDKMIANGLVDEVKGLIQKGYCSYDMSAMSGIGYRQVGLYLKGEKSLDEAVQLIKKESRRLVRQQYNWFKPQNDRIKWFNILNEPYNKISALVKEFIAGN
jgi:tRNA dimethylallyltransferase